jgi:hypothetical protein
MLLLTMAWPRIDLLRMGKIQTRKNKENPPKSKIDYRQIDE